LEQPLLSAPPVLHSGWAQVLPPVEHDRPQTDATSPTQVASQLLLQQNGSFAQMLVTHGSQPLLSAPPLAHLSCAQAPPPTHCPPALHVCPVAQLPQDPLQPSGPHCLPLQLGVHVATHWPLGLQKLPAAQLPH